MYKQYPAIFSKESQIKNMELRKVTFVTKNMISPVASLIKSSECRSLLQKSRTCQKISKVIILTRLRRKNTIYHPCYNLPLLQPAPVSPSCILQETELKTSGIRFTSGRKAPRNNGTVKTVLSKHLRDNQNVLAKDRCLLNTATFNAFAFYRK